MKATIETRLAPETIWKAWERAHGLRANGPIEPGQRANNAGFKYQILDVIPGKSFSILWKSLFVRMVFIHSLEPLHKGSRIAYSAEIRGFFAWPVRFFLKSKVQNNLRFVLKEFTRQLENN